MLWSLLFLLGSAHLDADAVPYDKRMLKLNWTTSQSSDFTDKDLSYSSERAIDGNLTECANTESLANSWWRIDLQAVYNISAVIIFNKRHHNSDISGAQIFIGNSRKNNGTTNTRCANITHFPQNQNNSFSCSEKILGRYITVLLPKRAALVLCEVSINGTMEDSPFVLIKQKKVWEDALYYCRDNYMDLASILNEQTQAWAELEAQKANTSFVWLGLHYTCTLDFWFWVEDHRIEFNRWAPDNNRTKCDTSAAMETQEEHLWFMKSDYETFDFICRK